VDPANRILLYTCVSLYLLSLPISGFFHITHSCFTVHKMCTCLYFLSPLYLSFCVPSPLFRKPVCVLVNILFRSLCFSVSSCLVLSLFVSVWCLYHLHYTYPLSCLNSSPPRLHLPSFTLSFIVLFATLP